MGVNGANRVGRAIRSICSLVAAFCYRQGVHVSWGTGESRPSNAMDPMNAAMPATDTTIVFIDVSSIIHAVLPKPKADTMDTMIPIRTFGVLFIKQIMDAVRETRACHATVTNTTEFTFFVVMDRYSLRRWFMSGKRRDVATADIDRVDLPYDAPPPAIFDTVTGAPQLPQTPAEMFADLRKPSTSPEPPRRTSINAAGLRSHIRSGTRYSVLFMQELQKWLAQSMCAMPRIHFQLIPGAPFDPAEIPPVLRCEWVPRASSRPTTSTIIDGANIVEAATVEHVVADAVASVVMAFHPTIAGGPQTSSIPEADMLIPACIRRILAARDTTGDPRTIAILVHSCDTDMIAALIYVGMANGQMGGTTQATPFAPQRAQIQVPIGLIQPQRVYGGVVRNLMLLPVRGNVTDWHTYSNLFGGGVDVSEMLARGESDEVPPNGEVLRVPSPTSRMACDDRGPDELSPSAGPASVHPRPPRIVPFSRATDGHNTVALFDAVTGAPRGGESHPAILYLNPMIMVLDESKCLGNRTMFLSLAVLNGTDFSGPTGVLSQGDDGFGLARELFWYYALAQIRALRRDAVPIKRFFPSRATQPVQMIGAIAACAAIMSAKPYNNDPFASHVFSHMCRPGSKRTNDDWVDLRRDAILAMEPITISPDGSRYAIQLPSVRAFFTTRTFDAEFLPALATFAYWVASLSALDGVVCSDGSTPALCRIHLNGMQEHSGDRLSVALVATPTTSALEVASESQDKAAAWTEIIMSAYRQMCVPFMPPPIQPLAPRKRAGAKVRDPMQPKAPRVRK